MQRRSILRGGLICGGVAFFGGSRALVERLLAQSCADVPLGDLIGVLPLQGDVARVTPFGQIVGGTGLDARMFTDLSRVQPDRLVTPTDEVFIRTTAPPSLRATPATWTIPVKGLDGAGIGPVSIDRLRRDAQPMGAHLIECSGNTDPNNFGLMSVAEWDGVPVSRALASTTRPAAATALLISGVDDHPGDTRSSVPGASWIAPLDVLERLGAFFAVRMNGAPLTPDHGAPVRLVIPGWYGCSWIKWVKDVQFVPADEPVTTQMLEFSRRTHQDGLPKLARDYDPPVIDLAATPIRVEKRRVNGRLEYRIVGIVWGGDKPVERLMIRFKAGETPQAFSICPAPRTHRAWSIWEYRWRPSVPGIYDIVLTAADPSVRTRRLDISFYIRRVVIDEAAADR